MGTQNLNINGYNMKLRDNGDSSFSATAAKNVQTIQVFNALAVRDTANHDSSLIDTTAMENASVFVTNTTNQAVSIQIVIYDPNGVNSYLVPTVKSVAAGTSCLVSSLDISILSVPFANMKVRAYCATAPTSGSVSAWVHGV